MTEASSSSAANRFDQAGMNSDDSVGAGKSINGRVVDDIERKSPVVTGLGGDAFGDSAHVIEDFRGRN